MVSRRRTPFIVGIAVVGLAVLGGGMAAHSASAANVTVLIGVVRKYRWQPVNIIVAASGTSPLSTPIVKRNGNALTLTRVGAYPQAKNAVVWIMEAAGGLEDGDTIEIDVSDATGAMGVYDTRRCKNYFGQWVACYHGAQR